MNPEKIAEEKGFEVWRTGDGQYTVKKPGADIPVSLDDLLILRNLFNTAFMGELEQFDDLSE